MTSNTKVPAGKPFRYCKRCSSYKVRQYSRTLLICDNCGSKTKMLEDEIIQKHEIRKFKQRIIALCEDEKGNIGCHHNIEDKCEHYCHTKTYEESITQ